MEQLMRNFFLFMAKNKTLTDMANKYGLRYGASRFVAGVEFEEAADKIKAMNDQWLVATADHRGEFVDNEEEAIAAADECIHAIEVMAEKELDSELSLKMTSMGLDISDELVMKNMHRILDTAQKHGITVTIDMEDFARCQKTLDIFKELKQKYDNVGTVLQAYLYRTVEDIKDLSDYKPYLRLVKGAYKE